jgi:hypothetical protein
MEHLNTEQLTAGLDQVIAAPKDFGTIEMIVRRPADLEREEIESGEINTEDGLVGDNWRTRGSTANEDGASNPEAQLTLMNSRMTDLVARSRDRWAQAGDQIYVDMDLSEDNIPVGSRLAVGSAIVEVSSTPHTGCAKFVRRFGVDAYRFVNTEDGLALRLRGVNTRVVRDGSVAKGDVVKKL